MTLASIERYDWNRVPDFGGHAVVVGASVAGLTTARVLLDGFDRVTVLEKDSLSEERVPRPGVPQGAQIHALLEAGRATLEDFLPGFGEELLSAGGMLIDGSTDIKYFGEGGFLADGTRQLSTYSASRHLFEKIIRQLVTDREGIRLRTGCHMIDYLVEDSARITGVRVSDRESGIEEIPADLVVDATGRTSRTPNLLEKHGFSAPPVDEVTIDIAYSTIAIERPPDDRRAILSAASPPHTRGGAVLPIKGGRWLMDLHGVHGDHPPQDLEDFHDFAKGIHAPVIGDLLDSYRVVSQEVEHYPFSSSRRHYYERLNAFPDGLVVVGDAVASFNPIYGQGMSVAALEALCLHHCLADGELSDIGSRFFDRTEAVVDNAWMMAVGADFQFPETSGPKPRGTDIFARYLSRLIRKAQTDGELRDAFFRVIMMEEPPKSLLNPSIIWKVTRPTFLEDETDLTANMETERYSTG